MKKPNSIYVAELVGIFGIIASLIFVGAQLVLDRNVAYGNAFQNRVLLNVENLIGQRDNIELVKSRATRYEQERPSYWSNEVDRYVKERSLSMEDVVRVEIHASIQFQITDNNFYQCELGLIDDDAWAGMRRGFSGNFLNPIGRSRILSAGYLRPSMQKMVDELAIEMQNVSPLEN